MRTPLYFRYLSILARGQASRRSNLLILAFSQLAMSASALLGILALFSRFDNLAGYGRHEVLLCFGLTQVAYSLAEMSARGFDFFHQVLAQGEFDRILLRPRGAMFQTLAARFELSRLGRFLAGAACLWFALSALLPGWREAAAGNGAAIALRLATIALMAAGGYAIFFGIFILGAAFSFLSQDSLELVNILSDGGREMSQYPLSIYDAAFRRFFTFIVPFGCVNYLPLEFVLGKGGSSPWAGLLPLAGFVFLGVCVLAWKAGARRYVSTGS